MYYFEQYFAKINLVVYQLNTKNEDSEAKLKFLRQKYEKELEESRSNTGVVTAVDQETKNKLLELEKTHQNLVKSLEEEKSRCDKFKSESQSLQEQETRQYSAKYLAGKGGKLITLILPSQISDKHL